MTQKRRKGDFREWKIQNVSRGSSPHTPLEACAFGAHLGNPSVCFLDPRPELAQVLHEKWGHLMLFPPSFESREPFRWMNHWKQQPASDYESISVFSQNRQHAENIFPNVRELLKIFAVLPMESTEVERSFSFMQRILTWLRIIMITERLSDFSPCTHMQLPLIVAWFVRNLWRCTLDEWRRLHFSTKLLFLLFCGVSRLCNVRDLSEISRGEGGGILNLGSEVRWPIPAMGVKFANPLLDLGLKYHDPPPLVYMIKSSSCNTPGSVNFMKAQNIFLICSL